MFRLALIYIVFITSLSADEIWDKEIPPSHYLKEFAIKSENDNSKILRHSSYVFIFLGLLMGNNENNTGPEAEYVGDLFLLGGGVGLLIDQIRKLKAFDKPRTPSGKEYKKIKNIDNREERESLVYEALVRLAENSRIKKNKILNQQKASLKDKESVNKKYVPFKFKILKKILDGPRDAIKDRRDDVADEKISRAKAELTSEERLLVRYLNQVPIR